MHGSDHRPVQLGVTLKDFKFLDFQELPRLLDLNNPRMGYGEVKITSVKLDKLDFSKSLLLKTFMNSAVTEDAIHLHTLSFRVSFYDVALDRIMAPLTFSERRHIRMSPGDGQDNL